MTQKPEATEITETYARFTFKKVLFIIASLTGLGGLVLLATSMGASNLSVNEIFNTIIARTLPFIGVESDLHDEIVIWNLRLPRVVMAVVAGAGLAVSGAVMQGVMRNPLVSPFTIGISSAAAFGASIAIMFGVGFIGSGTYLIVVNAFIFALLCAFLVYGIARIRGVTPETLILAGIALMYLFGALTATLQFIASEQELMAVIHWTFGTLTGSSWNEILIVTLILLVCLPFLIWYAWDLNAMASGEEVAKSLGVNTSMVRTVSLTLATLITAGVICFTGIIGFVCLVAPHITRMLIGGDHRFLIPCSCIFGAILLLAADTAGRMLFSPVIIPVGIVISYIGVPLFLYLLMKTRREYWG
ncbi:MAG: iron ABC transporter permease [Methanophagales archaeon]|nr:iron ABC transporter permease [Methanophagales archaeon]